MTKKQTKTATKSRLRVKQKHRINYLGGQIYGAGWPDKRTEFKVANMTPGEATALIVELQKILGVRV